MSFFACAASDTPTLATSPIHNVAELQAHLKDSIVSSPLYAMPRGARKRFITALTFGPEGVSGFSTAELNETLTSDQILAVLALFELEAYAGMMEGVATRRTPRDHLSEFERRFDAFQVEEAPGNIDYRALLAGSEPLELAHSLDSYDRALLYRAMLDHIGAGGPIEVVDDAGRLLDVMHASGEATRTQYRRLFESLVALRKFSAAGKLAVRYPDAGLPPLPSFSPSALQGTGNPALQVSADGSRMTRVEVDIERGLHIVVVAGCHFARDASLGIAADPALDRLFQQRSTWLAPSSESIAAAVNWNREFPNRPILIAWRDEDWPQITSWAMPTFLVFRDGALIRSWSGWPADTGIGTLRAELAAAGVSY